MTAGSTQSTTGSTAGPVPAGPCQASGARCGRVTLTCPVNLPHRAQHNAYAAAERALECGDVALAYGRARTLVEQTNERDAIDWQLTSWILLARCELLAGRRDEAIALLNSVAETAQRGGVLQEQLLAALYHLALLAYDTGQSRELLRYAQFVAELRGGLDCRCLYTLRSSMLAAVVNLVKGMPGAAQEDLFKLVHSFKAFPSWTLPARLLLAESMAMQGDERSAEEQLELADALLARLGLWGVSLEWLPRLPHARLLVTRQFPHWPDTPAPRSTLAQQLGTTRPEAAIQLVTLGQWRARVFGQEMELAQSTEGRIAVVFGAYLALRPGMQVSVGDAIEDNFANLAAPEDKLKRVLRLTREYLGAANVGNRHGVLSLAPDTWLDVHAFERAYERARTVPLESRMEALRAAAVLYRGEFLQGGPKLNWLIDMRSRLQSRMVAVLMEMAKIYDRSQDVQSSIDLLERALEVDPCADPAAVALLRQLDRLGQRSRALSVCATFLDSYRSRWKTDPSPEFQDLYRSFMQRSEEQVTGAFEPTSRRTPPQGVLVPSSFGSGSGIHEEMRPFPAQQHQYVKYIEAQPTAALVYPATVQLSDARERFLQTRARETAS